MVRLFNLRIGIKLAIMSAIAIVLVVAMMVNQQLADIHAA
jgi:hypothetical protein